VERTSREIDFQCKAALVAHLRQSGRVEIKKHEGDKKRVVTKKAKSSSRQKMQDGS
jgi:hypothetical protein